MTASKARETTLGASVSLVEFSPRFLKQLHPHFAIATVRKGRTSSRVAGQVVVDNDGSLDAVDIESDEVAASVVDLIRIEEVFDLFCVFGHAAQHGEEVAVAESALLYIVWVDAFREDLRVFIDLADSPPFKLFVFAWLDSVDVRVVQRAQLRRKFSVSPSLARCNDRVSLSFQVSSALLVPFHGLDSSFAVAAFDHVAISTRGHARTVSHFFKGKFKL